MREIDLNLHFSHHNAGEHWPQPIIRDRMATPPQKLRSIRRTFKRELELESNPKPNTKDEAK